MLKWSAGGVVLTMLFVVMLFRASPVSEPRGPTKHLPPISGDAVTVLMQPVAGKKEERWRDLADNPYSRKFRRGFRYDGSGNWKPRVTVTYSRRADTFRGRVVAEQLKPNCAYQMKLQGRWEDRTAFERIGRVGRWWLPAGSSTNFTDEDYERFAQKEKAAAYIFFDFFVTDERGHAEKDFSLDSSLHVLWHTPADTYEKESPLLTPRSVLHLIVSNPDIYENPSSTKTTAGVVAEAEQGGGRAEPRSVRLPDGEYNVTLLLTEESFHGSGDAGWWASVMQADVSFEIAP